MMRIVLSIVALSMFGACRLHLSQVRENNVIDLAHYEAIELGRDHRRDVMALLGPPDRVVYGRSELFFEYVWARHRGTDTRLFVPSEIIPGFDPLFFLSIPRYLFDLSEEPEEFRPNFVERLAEGLARLSTAVVPFADGQDLLIVRGHQLRRDSVRIAFDRESLLVHGKSMRFGSGEYRGALLTDRILLRADRVD